MLSYKGGLTAAFALWLFVLGLVLHDQLILLSSVPVVVYIVISRLMDSRPHLDLLVERASVPESIYEGEIANIAIRLTNRGTAIDTLELFDSIPAGLRLVKGSNRLVTPIAGGATLVVEYSVEPEVFGVYRIGPTKVRTTDLSRSRIEEKEEVDSLVTLSVYPGIRYVSRIGIRPNRPRNWPGETVSRRSGSGMDFYAIREYVQGESVRRVNWKASSREDKVLVNQYHDEAGGDIVIVLDRRQVSEVGRAPDSTLTHATRAVATISYRLLRGRNRVGLIGMGENFVRLPPGSGRRQFERILASLLLLVTGDGWDIDNLPGLLSLYFSRQTQIVLVSPLIDGSAASTVVRISKLGYRVTVLSPSPISVSAVRPSEGPATPTMRVAEDIVRLRRDSQLSFLRRYATVVDWDTYEPLSSAIYKLAEFRSRASTL